MTWHQWHQTAPMSRRMGLSSDLARAKAASPHSCQSMGWWAAERRYGLAESFRRFSGWSVKQGPFTPAGEGKLRPYKNGHRAEQKRLLNDVAGAEVAGVERLAASEAFVLAMVKTNAVLAEFPAEIHILMVDDGGEIKEADVEVLDDAPGFENAIEGGLENLAQLVVLQADGGEFVVRDDDAAHHHDARGDGGELVFEAGQLFAGVHGFDEERLEFLARPLCFGQRKEPLWWFRSFVLFRIVVVFVGHRVSVLGTGFHRERKTG